MLATSLAQEDPMYFVGPDEDALCPTGTKQIDTEGECQSAALQLGKKKAFVGIWQYYISGCMRGKNNIHWNQGGQEKGPHGYRVCKTQGGDIPAANETGHTAVFHG